MKPGSAVPALAALDAGATEAAAASTASLPFKTVAFDDNGSGHYFAAGSSETVVLNSKADLDAFVARHKAAVAPVAGPPQPNASAGPPEIIPMTPPPGVGPAPVQPVFQAQALPATLTGLDFGKYEAIAFFDGQVKVASESRILAVQDQGSSWIVSTKRWEPPANPDAIPDVNGRLHVIAIARASKPVSFAPIVVDDKGAGPNGGGYGVGGNPTMNPQWPPVQNPDITQASIEAGLRAGQAPGAASSVDVALKPLAGPSYTFPAGSLVWVATITGTNLQGGGPVGTGLGSPSIGGTPPTVTQETLFISPEDGDVFESTSKTAPGTPGFSFNDSLTGSTYLGDSLTFKVSGPMQPGTLQLSIKKPDGTVIWNKAVAYADLASFSLKLDPADVPGIQDVAVQDLELDEKFDNGSQGHPFQLLKDRNAQPAPGEPVSRGLYDGLDLNASVDKFANDIATNTWQGKNLHLTTRDATAADLTLDPIRFVLTPDAKQHFYEFKGTFPEYLLPALSSGTGAEAVLTPTVVRLVIAAETNNLIVLSDRGFAQ